MTTDTPLPHHNANDVLPEELLLRRDRLARQRLLANRSLEHATSRRRLLPPALIASAFVAIAGLADHFVQAKGAASATVSTAPRPVVPTSTASLAQVAATLAADQRAIAGIASAQAQLARSVAQAGGDSSSTTTQSALQLPALPSLPSLPNAAAATAQSVAPSTHASTGASVVLP